MAGTKESTEPQKVFLGFKGLNQRVSEGGGDDGDLFDCNAVYPTKAGCLGKLPGKSYFQKLVNEPILNIVQTFDSRSNVIIQTTSTVQIMSLDDFYLNPYTPSLTPVIFPEEETMSRALLSNAQAAGTSSGVTVATSYTQCPINTIVSNDGSFLSLTSNQFTLPSGSYRIKIRQAICATTSVKFVGTLFNVTGNAKAFVTNTDCTMPIIGLGTTVNGFLYSEGVVNPSVPTVYQFQVKASASTTNGLGIAGNLGENEVYLLIEILKVS